MSIADKYQVVQSTKTSQISSILLATLIIVLFAAPYWAGSGDLRLLSEIFLYLSLAILWNLLAGYAGLVSIGQQAFVGFGGYILFSLAMFANIPPLLAVPVAGLAGAIVAVPIAFLVFRLRGAYFAIGTWVVAEVFRLVFAQISSLGGGSGTSLPATIVKSIASTKSMREATTYWVILSIVVLILLSVYFFLRSKNGIALRAIKDNELAAESFGINIWRTKFVIYIATAALTSITGALIYLQKLRISPEAAFSVNDWTAIVIFMVVIGGIGSIEGPIIGVILYFILREMLADLGTIYLLILGCVAIVIMLRAPRGVWGYFRDRYNIELFPIKRSVVFKNNKGVK